MIKIFYLLTFDLEDRLFKRKVHGSVTHCRPTNIDFKLQAYISPLISAFPEFSASSVSSHPSEEKKTNQQTLFC